MVPTPPMPQSNENLVGSATPLPQRPTRVHLLGICGTAMGSLAGMFREQGCLVTGSDNGVYPPMSDFLRSLGIKVTEGYSSDNLNPRPDLVVVGNVIRKSNPEAQALEASGIPFTSLPGALNSYFVGNRTRIVVTGTHGKTTVSSMIAWVLSRCGMNPGFMIGGLPVNFGSNYGLGNGRFFVLEGDEYDTAYFDKSPKFIHYRPDIAVVTSCEFDHGDIYSSMEEIVEQFRAFARLVSAEGSLVAFGGDPRVMDISSGSRGAVLTYGLDPAMDWSVERLRDTAKGMHAVMLHNGKMAAEGTIPVFGVHNLMNAMAAVAVADLAGIEPQEAMDALAEFKGVKRRQEIVAEEAGVLLLDDFAHHPTAVRETCSAIRGRFPLCRLVAVFEPRTNTSRRSFFQKEYVSSFQAADLVVLREPREPEKFPEGDRFSSEQLAADLRELGKRALAFGDTDRIVEFLGGELRDGDVALVMSNGSFDGLASRLAAVLKEKRR